MAYNIIRLSLKEYLKYRITRHGIKYLCNLTSSHYPKILALGVCYHSTKEIVIAKVGRWELRELHEIGHSDGLHHTSIWKIGYLMNPYGILRGYKC